MTTANEAPTREALLNDPLDATQLQLLAETTPDHVQVTVDLHDVHLEKQNEDSGSFFMEPDKTAVQFANFQNLLPRRSMDKAKTPSESLGSVPLNGGLTSTGKPNGGSMVNGKFVPHSVGELRREVDPTGKIVEHRVRRSAYVHERLHNLTGPQKLPDELYDAAEKFRQGFERAQSRPFLWHRREHYAPGSGRPCTRPRRLKTWWKP